MIGMQAMITYRISETIEAQLGFSIADVPPVNADRPGCWWVMRNYDLSLQIHYRFGSTEATFYIVPNFPVPDLPDSCPPRWGQWRSESAVQGGSGFAVEISYRHLADLPLFCSLLGWLLTPELARRAGMIPDITQEKP